MGILDVNIKLDRANRVYLDYETVSGRAEFKITGQRVRIGSLKLYVNGFSQYQSIEDNKSSHSQMVKLSKIEEEHHLFCFLNIVTKEKYGDEIYLETGDYSYPFEIKLPGMLPSTMKSEYVTVLYRLALIFDLPWPAPNKRDMQEFTVIRALSYEAMAGEAQSLRPSTQKGYKAFNCWCCKTLPVVGQVMLDKTLFGIGEVIPFRIEVDNRSPRLIKKIEVKLMRTVRFYYKKEKRLERVCLASVEHNSRIEPGTVYTWSDGRIDRIPFTQPNSTIKIAKVFELCYSLVAKFVPAAPLAFSFTTEIAIAVSLPKSFNVPPGEMIQDLSDKPFVKP